MDHKFVREIIKAFSKIGHVEYRFMKNRIDICKDNRVIAAVKDDYLYLADKEEKLIQVTDSNVELCANLNKKLIIAYNFKSKLAMQ